MSLVKINYFTNKINDISIEVNEYLLHSKYNPIREVQELLKNKFEYDKITVFFGNGRGYLCEVLKEMKVLPENVLIIDPIQEFNKFNDPFYDIDYGFDINRIKSLLSKKNKFYSDDIRVICMPNYQRIFPDEYLEIINVIKAINTKNSIYMNTINKLSVIWQENDIKNIYHFTKAHSLNALKGCYTEPVIVASAGPSLVKQLPLLRKIRKNVILIASGSAIDTLIANNIEPDFVVSVDGSEVNYNYHFKDLDLKNTSLIFSNTSNYKVQYHFKNEQYAFIGERDKKFLSFLKEQFGLDLPLIKGEGSVATYALSIARFITKGPIALIGQDLSYTNMQSHALGNKCFNYIEDESFLRNKLFEVQGYYGEKVLTDAELYLMKGKLEDLICDMESHQTIFNCTEGGVKLKGFKHLSFYDFCEVFVDNSVHIIEHNIKTQQINKDIILYNLNKDINSYIKMQDEIKRAIDALTYNNLQTEFEISTLEILDEVDKKVDKLMLTTPMERIKDPITLDIMTNYKAKGIESNLEKFNRVYSQNLNYYLKMDEALRTVIAITEEWIDELVSKHLLV